MLVATGKSGKMQTVANTAVGNVLTISFTKFNQANYNPCLHEGGTQRAVT